MKAALAAAAALLAPAASAPDISSLNIEALQVLRLDKVEWKPADGIGGTDTAVLVGDPAKPGLYVVLNRFHPGAHSRPHYHPGNRYIMVVKGPWYVSTGLSDDIEKTGVPMPQGSFITHTGREVHYDGAKAGGGEAIVMIFGNGPGTRIDCVGPNAEKGPGPCRRRGGQAMIRLARLALCAAVLGGAALAQDTPPVNDGPNPYRVIRDWARFEAEKRPWGGSNGVAMDKDGRTVWALDRCSPGPTPGCLGSAGNPVHHFDENGREIASFGAGLFVWPHGLHVDEDGNVWVADARVPTPEEMARFPGPGRWAARWSSSAPRAEC